MCDFKISSQAAAAICKAERLGKVPPLREAWLLQTGAKLVNQDGQYLVYGYAALEEDLKPYRKYQRT